ncbi:Fur family zinc uptake transcriptional regulator [Natronocella acetinitrilica]|uniref:Fur family zinc uptake transcriptional regulator n=1 Tax=Natronocella acetinitrilica TaxID=414046 RepID=A0AAE3KF58_9GAMM|nr:Fur family transcriptional regulator [Natronocella acetinitrilica]MCP1673747.1 Fur family zinc uptake transcriptional regulator [Natronocella acetinitrilica]
MANHVVTPFRDPDHDHGLCVDEALKLAEHNCAVKGVRLTRIRARVLELIWRRHEPVKAYDLLDELRSERRSAAPPTIYRALDFLLGEGLIHRIESLNAYVGCGDPGHPHLGQFLICQQCNAVAEMSDPDVTSLLQKKAEHLGFSVNWQTIEINGLCPECRESPQVSG